MDERDWKAMNKEQKEYTAEFKNQVKNLTIPDVIHSVCNLSSDYREWLVKQGETNCDQCGKPLKVI